MSTRYRRRPDLRVTALEGEGVVLHLGSREYFTVSETGLLLLEALEADRTLDQLASALTDVYDVSTAEALRSVQGFLDLCASHGLLIGDREA